jgi:hypothetical protein
MLARLIADFPFVLALLASVVAAASAVLLRRAAPSVGPWAAQAGSVLWLLSLAVNLWSLLWAYSLRIGPGSPGVVTSFGTYGLIGPEAGETNLSLPQLLAGLAALAAGGWLAVWVLRERARLGLLTAPLPALVERLPYQRLRRPGLVGLILLALGLTILAESLPLWVWFVLWLPTALTLAEMAEWEQRRRYPELTNYFHHTPRYLPRPVRRSRP